ncbi:hypothetical protein [Adhaeretor mobilis]|uniref:Uncharacterized protein n=1 Tax=Adhaeretor mobilis TaxID=1930276 RepID=A0A517N0P5_9BACT|nr:hypothetical protein [Adhaeretor mobilis]QDT00710.1 hypothetical protein HG15A2_40500 [Adhaeretor mobilis]
MNIELPEDLITRLQERAATNQNANPAEIIRKALDSLDWAEQERAAIQAGVDAWKAGEVQDFNELDREFREKNNIPADA